MTENEALEALADELVNGESGEAVEANESEPQGEAQSTEANAQEPQAKEPSNAELMAELQALKQQGQPQTEPQKEAVGSEAQTTLANKEAMAELGLGEAAEQLQNGLNFIEQQKRALAEQKEYQRQVSVFENNIAKFKEKYPTIAINDFRDFIEKNNFKGVLGESFESWDLIGRAMINIAKTDENKADDITPSGGGGVRKSAFDRVKDGDEVSDIELGAELLNL